ncbi:MAG: hypothetical protein Q8M11_05145 [Sulfuritalea sp.]|nr:hypothetical protein [Sulfuritalea sp.]MDP1983866.1 hypothetical protein [Sulfuritalea sp.]
MNENHRRHLASTFRHMDALLIEAGRILDASAASPFECYIQDASLAQRGTANAHIVALRERMLRIMSDSSIPSPAPSISACWAARGLVGGARIALAELRPKAMRGYGPLSEADGGYLDVVVAELEAALSELDAILARDDAPS